MTRSLTLPRSLTVATIRAGMPQTAETPEPDTVLIASLVDAVRTLQELYATQQDTVDRLTRRVSYLEGSTAA